VFAIRESATSRVLPRIANFTLFAVAVCFVDWLPHTPQIRIEVAPLEFAGAVLGLLLVHRTNAGYDRWWEGRKLWGAIVNQCRELAIGALAYGPADPGWREAIVRWTVAFAHVTRRSLRDERTLPEVATLLGDDEARRIAAAEHMPSAVLRTIAALLRQARDSQGLDPFAFLQIDRARAVLIDDVGGCERILSAPLPLAYSIHLRQFVFLYLVTLPVALLHTFGPGPGPDDHSLDGYVLTVLITSVVAYPILALDQIGVELQNPFSTARMGHLALDEITTKIETNLLALLEDRTATPVPAAAAAAT
jgi:putative membrane protein